MDEKKKKDRTTSGLKKLGMAALTIAGLVINVAVKKKS